MTITQIDGLVHPYDSQDFRKALTPHPIEAELRTKWVQRAHALAENPSAVLFYFPGSVTKEQIVPQGGTKLINEVQVQEMIMLEQLRNILGDRFIVFPYNEETYEYGKVPSREMLRVLKERGFEIDPKVHATIYGESMNACVEVWGKHVQDVLHIPREQVHYDDDMSITIQRENEIRGTGWLK